MNRCFCFFKRTVASSPTLVLIVVALFAAPQLVHADVYVPLASQAPNWNLGSPQFVSLSWCSDLDPGACGGVSDMLSLTVLTRPTVTGILNEGPESRPPVIFRVGAGGAIDITIPNANWVTPRTRLWRENLNETVASDGLWLYNVGFTAHAWLGSGISDLDGSLLPGTSDILDLYPNAVFGPTTDISFTSDSNGFFTSQDTLVTPEPSLQPLLLLLMGVAGITLVARRHRMA